VGAVLAFAPTGRMRLGHVAMVSEIVSDREVLLTHANWSHRGRVETNVRAIDVSDAGDWSKVKVWYGPNDGLGASTYPTKGFIYSDHATSSDDFDSVDKKDEAAAMEVASADTSMPGITVRF
jgi:surface antigen